MSAAPTSSPSRLPLRLAAISAGLAIATSCFPLLAVTVAEVGLWAVPAIAVAALLTWLVSRLYGALAQRFPTAAGVRTYVGYAFGSRAGITMAVLYLFMVVALGAAEASILAQVLAHVFDGLSPSIAIIGFIALCGLANVVGFETAGRLQLLLTIIVLGGVLILATTGAFHHGLVTTFDTAFAFPGAAPLALALATVVFLFVGFEWVVSAVEDAGDRGRWLPTAMSWAIGALALVYMVLAAAMALAVPRDVLLTGVPHVVMSETHFGTIGAIAMVGLSVAATVTSFNSGILGASRLLSALAREGAVPRILASFSTRFLTPWVAILTVTTVTATSALTLASSQLHLVPIAVGAAIECVVFGAVAVAYARLLRAGSVTEVRGRRATLNAPIALMLAAIFIGLAVGNLAALPGAELEAVGLFLAALLVAGVVAGINIEKPQLLSET